MRATINTLLYLLPNVLLSKNPHLTMICFDNNDTTACIMVVFLMPYKYQKLKKTVFLQEHLY